MKPTVFEDAYSEFVRRGDVKKVQWLDELPKRIPLSLRKRIQANDKTVLHETVLPKWVKWDLLYSWANQKADTQTSQTCTLCSESRPSGIQYNNRFICEKCFKTLRNM